jgi:hypothetical protein
LERASLVFFVRFWIGRKRKERTKGKWEDIANNKKLKIVESKREKMSGEDCVGKGQNVERGNQVENRDSRR